MFLQNKNITLRALEPEDLDLLYKWENDTNMWSISCASEPYSHYILKEYIAYSDKTIYEKKQLRLIITIKSSNETIGIIDLFDFDAFHQRAGVGILIDPKYQRKGFATEALNLLVDYSFNFLNINQLYAHIPTNNHMSTALFNRTNFTHCGTLKKWLRNGDEFIDVDIYQLTK